MPRIALLHLAPRPAALDANTALVLRGLEQAAASGAQWVITPELSLTGYEFAGRLGSDWIQPADLDPWVSRLRQAAARLGVTLFLGHPERDRDTGDCHNAVMVIGPDGLVWGAHRKLAVIPGAEDWSRRGTMGTTVAVGPVRVGLLVCADTWRPELAQRARDNGAQLLISPSAWPPRPHGPDGCWSARSVETGLPLIVCNRTGMDESLDFSEGESGVFVGGVRQYGFSSPTSALVVLDWDQDAQRVRDAIATQLDTERLG